VTVNIEENLQCCTAKKVMSPKLKQDRTDAGSNRLKGLYPSVFSGLKEKFIGKFTPASFRVGSKNKFLYRGTGLTLALPLINT
jgi:hypothetical protein